MVTYIKNIFFYPENEFLRSINKAIIPLKKPPIGLILDTTVGTVLIVFLNVFDTVKDI
jgi:hypothetical protein